MKTLVLRLLVFCFLLITVNGKDDVLLKSWDKNITYIEDAYTNIIPKSFQPEGKAVSVETISRKEFEKAALLLYGVKPKEVKDVVGMYLTRANKDEPKLPKYGSMIFLVDDKKYKNIKYTFIHEFGHFCYAEECNDLDRDSWNILWLKEYEDGNLPTLYSYANKYEGFAEVFANYCLDKTKLDSLEIDYFDSLSKRLGTVK